MRWMRDSVIRARSSDRGIEDRWPSPTLRGERRWAARAEVGFGATLRARELNRCDVEVMNFSRFGCAIEGAAVTAATGAYCWLTVPTLKSWYAKVAWQNESCFGLDFADPFHPAVVDMIVARDSSARDLGHKPDDDMPRLRRPRSSDPLAAATPQPRIRPQLIGVGIQEA